jgi:hypothetical protein
MSVNMKHSIVPVLLALISVASPAGATDFNNVGTYTYDCSCYNKPPGGVFSTGVCYTPGSKVPIFSGGQNYGTFPDFTINPSSPTYPNSYTSNGFQFIIAGNDEISFVANCSTGKIAKVKFDKYHNIDCSNESSSKHSKTIRCRNKDSGQHHLNIEYYQCGCSESK